MLRDDIKGLQRATPRDLRKFGLMVGGVFLVLGSYFYLRHKLWWAWFVAAGTPLFLIGAVFPRGLKWVYVAWMTLAMILGAIVSAILLTGLFYLVVTPIGLLARVVGKDFLRKKMEPATASYWLLRDVSKPKQKHEHEQQY
jgi:hypothetical protein